VPTKRSAVPFCQGLRNAVRRGWIPKPAIEPATSSEKIESLSKIKKPMEGFVGERITELLNHPASGWVCRHVEVKNPASTMIEREPDVEQLEADRRHDEEVHSGDHVAAIPQEGDPSLLGPGIGLGLVARDRREAHLDSELRQLGLDLPSSPVILGRHPNDECLDVFRDRRSPGSGHGDRTPVAAKSLAVPADHRLWLNDEEGAPPSRPEPGKGDPEGTIQRRETRSRMSMREDRELLAQRELDDRLVLAAPEQSEDAPKNRDRESHYGPPHSRILRESRPRKEA
jgi:hypothetical protein